MIIGSWASAGESFAQSTIARAHRFTNLMRTESPTPRSDSISGLSKHAGPRYRRESFANGLTSERDPVMAGLWKPWSSAVF